MSASISPAELQTRLASANPPRLLDVREPEEHAFAALPGSTLIPLAELAARTDELAPWQDEEIVVYCHHGVRSLHGISVLRHFGFMRLVNLSGGIDAWSREVDATVPRY